jgi:hypothetical protein
MSNLSPVFPSDSPPSRLLQDVARDARCSVICGIPGAGKSLLVREQILIARGLGRSVHCLQWDRSRLVFDQPQILARYPEIDNVTHPVLRRAAGLWVRGAVADWFASHSDSKHLLVVEAPFVGGRFIELAVPGEDAAERFLAADSTRFLVPQPTREVRSALEAARARDSAHHRHALDAKSAPPALAEANWKQLLASADVLGITRDRSDSSYSPEVYFAVYRHLLRHRRVDALPVSQLVRVASSAHELGENLSLLAPTDTDAVHLVNVVENSGVDHAVRATEAWYDY